MIAPCGHRGRPGAMRRKDNTFPSRSASGVNVKIIGCVPKLIRSNVEKYGMNDSSILPPAPPPPPGNCICLIGMPGAGKTALGRALAAELGMAHMDTDALIEAHYGTRLQAVTDSMGKEEFLDVEGYIIGTVLAANTVISTGGTAVSRPHAVRRLRARGPVVSLRAALPVILERIATAQDRGIAIAPGETIEDLYHERARLYESAANLIFEPEEQSVQLNAEKLAHLLKDSAFI